MMIELKSFIQSRTVWANGIGMIALLLSVFGFHTPVLDKEQIVDAILQIVAGGSFLASTVFRVVATKKIVL